MGALVKDPDNIRLGMIGMTPGNGHPYSWSAIFNKYDREAMPKECPYSGIPLYLSKEIYEEMGIPGAKVSCVYCNSRKDAEHVAKLSLIPEVVDSPEEMIGKVDAVIIATDIGSEHVERARPFMDAGIPIFIDKPLCDNYEDLCFFRDAEARGVKFCSSSSMRYCKEFIPFHNGRIREVGIPRLMTINMCKSWEAYGIHALEAIYPIAGAGFVSIRNIGDDKNHNIVHLKHRNGFDVVIGSIYDMIFDPTITISGTQGVIQIRTTDSYSGFRTQLTNFIDYLRTGISPVPFSETDELMQLVIGGIVSKKENGREVFLKEFK
ncbi:MAG: Gfo/Idh/MocA family oxidoreductase [Lentisphaeria bacterium]|nr:Gfo/Idh/MocA family oxidoreductase [Lentisphaeria bacterium]